VLSVIERQSARMSKTTNDGLTGSGTGALYLYPYGNSGRQRVKPTWRYRYRRGSDIPRYVVAVKAPWDGASIDGIVQLLPLGGNECTLPSAIRWQKRT